MYNTIILMKGEKNLTSREYKKFNKGDIFCGVDPDPEEIKRYPAEMESEAREELKKYHCSYTNNNGLYSIVEYAINFCECDENGEIVDEYGYDLASEVKELYFIHTNGYNMVVSVDGEKNCRYLTETEDFPSIANMDPEDRKKAATKFLETVEDDSSWEDDCSYFEIFDENPRAVEIIAWIEKSF